MKKAILIFFLILLALYSNASQMTITFDNTIQSSDDYYEINQLNEDGHLETSIAVSFWVPEGRDVVVSFDAFEWIPHGPSTINGIKICRGNVKGFSNAIDPDCKEEINYKTTFSESQTRIRPTKQTFHTYASEEYRFTSTKAGSYLIKIDYTTENFLMKKGFKYFVNFNPACHLYNKCPSESRVYRLVIFPGKDYDFERISPKPHNLAMMTANESWFIQFRSAEPIWITYVDSNEVYFMNIFLPLIVGTFIGLIPTIYGFSKKFHKVKLPKGIGPKTLEKLDNASLKIIKK